MSGINILRRLLLIDAVKGSGQASGIMSIGDSVRNLAEKRLQSFLLSAKKQGVDLDKLSEQELRYIIELNKPQKPKIISADSPEGKGITEALLGKRGQVIEGNFGKPFAKEAENKKNIAAMKKRKMIKDAVDNASPGFVKGDRKYNAQLVAEDLADKKFGKDFYDLDQKQQMDLYDDALEGLSEQTRGMPDPEDFATGGRAGFSEGNGVADEDAENAKFVKRVKELMDEGFDMGEAVREAMKEGYADGGRIGFKKGAVAGGGNISPGTDVQGNVRDDNPFTGGGKDEPPSPPTKDTKQKTPVVVNPIKNLQTHFANNQKLKDAVALGLITNDEYNILGGYDAKQTLGMGPIDTGLSSLAYNVVQSFKGDQPFSDIFGDVSRNVKGASGISPELQAKYENIMQMADGGRIGLKKGMDRRTFMKIMGGLTTIPVLGKFFKGAKVASKAAPVVKEAVTSGGTPPPYFFNLVKKIKNLGDDVTKTRSVSERQKVTAYKDYELTEDLTTGEKTIQRIKIDDGNPTYYDEVLAEETYMNYKPGKGQADEATGKVADEYTEDTSYIRTSGPQKGDIYDTVEGVADDVIEEGTVFEDNVTDFATKKIKKAGGGIARMLGE
jgi:hypothetical protein